MKKELIGVVHLLPLPGSPGFDASGGMARILEAAEKDAQALKEGGCSALIVENFGDVPFFAESVAAETVASMAVAIQAVRTVVGQSDVPVGANVLRNDARSALGLCAATGATFLRVNVHTGAMLTDQGLIQGRAAETLRERARLAPKVEIWADVHVKHASPMGNESLEEAARDAAKRGLADRLIVSGSGTGEAPLADKVQRVAEAAAGSVPVLVGSGLDLENASDLLRHADGAIVGTWLKRDGRVDQPVDSGRVRELRERFL